MNSLPAEKFAPFLKQNYTNTFSHRQNTSAKKICEWWQKNNNMEVTVTDKEDGVAVLLVVTFEQISEAQCWKLFNDHVVFETKNNADAGAAELLQDTATRNSVLKNFMDMWLHPEKCFSLERVSNCYYKIAIQLFAPTHHQKPLFLPHLFRREIEIALSTIIHKNGKDHLNQQFSLCFRCELIVGNSGPWAATAMVQRWRKLKKSETTIVKKRTDKSSKSSRSHSVCKEAHDFVMYVVNEQWNSKIWQSDHTRLCILDLVSHKDITPTGLRYFSFNHDETALAETCEMDRQMQSMSFAERHDLLTQYLTNKGTVFLVKCNLQIKNFIENGDVTKINNELHQYEINYDHEGFMICLEDKQQDNERVYYFKLKHFQILTLSSFECKMTYDWKNDNESNDASNMNLLYFFSGYHFASTQNFRYRHHDSGSKRIAPNCFKLCRWGNFKDLHSSQNQSADDESKLFCDMDDWNKTKFCFLWSHYIKEGRVRLNYRPMTHASVRAKSRIQEFITDNKPAQYDELKFLEQNYTEETARQYDLNVLKDACWSMLWFLWMRHQSKQEIDRIWHNLGLISKQMFKNMVMMDSYNCIIDNKFVASFFNDCQNLTANLDLDTTQVYQDTDSNTELAKTEWMQHVAGRDAAKLSSDPRHTQFTQWQHASMVNFVHNFYPYSKFKEPETNENLRIKTLFDYAAEQNIKDFNFFLQYVLSDYTTGHANSDFSYGRGAEMKFFYKKTFERLRGTDKNDWRHFMHVMTLMKKGNKFDDYEYDVKQGKVPNLFDVRLTPFAQSIAKWFNYNHNTQFHDTSSIFRKILQDLSIQGTIADDLIKIHGEMQQWWQDNFSKSDFFDCLKTQLHTELTDECYQLLFHNNQNPVLPEEFFYKVKPGDMQCKLQLWNDTIFKYLLQHDVMYSWSVGYNDAIHHFHTTKYPEIVTLLRNFATHIDTISLYVNDFCEDETMRTNLISFVENLNDIFEKIIKINAILVDADKHFVLQFKNEEAKENWEQYSKFRFFETEFVRVLDEPDENLMLAEGMQGWQMRMHDFWSVLLDIMHTDSLQDELVEFEHDILKHKNTSWILGSWHDLNDNLNPEVVDTEAFDGGKEDIYYADYEAILETASKFANHNHLNLKFGARSSKTNNPMDVMDFRKKQPAEKLIICALLYQRWARDPEAYKQEYQDKIDKKTFPANVLNDRLNYFSTMAKKFKKINSTNLAEIQSIFNRLSNNYKLKLYYGDMDVFKEEHDQNLLFTWQHNAMEHSINLIKVLNVLDSSATSNGAAKRKARASVPTYSMPAVVINTEKMSQKNAYNWKQFWHLSTQKHFENHEGLLFDSGPLLHDIDEQLYEKDASDSEHDEEDNTRPQHDAHDDDIDNYGDYGDNDDEDGDWQATFKKIDVEISEEQKKSHKPQRKTTLRPKATSGSHRAASPTIVRLTEPDTDFLINRELVVKKLKEDQMTQESLQNIVQHIWFLAQHSPSVKDKIESSLETGKLQEIVQIYLDAQNDI